VRLPERLTASLGIGSDAGVIVLGVEPGGPADAGGVLVGDVVVAVNDAPVRDTADVLALLGPERVGTAVRVRVVRAGALLDLSVTVGERPRRGA
jgi:S1-C subfamily serine protease